MKTLLATAAALAVLGSAAFASDEFDRRANDAAGAVALGILQQNPTGGVFDVQVSGGAATYDDYSGGALLVGTNFTENLYGNLGVFTGFDGEDVGVAASVTYTFGR